ncbi:LysR family transcriptional regulator [Luteolibacter sp. AS25]|uniref:LysR family transcriptional regulator n=1 Tax=Luteolibacter sp. AS25 TaxID=3135776 RepID=UPI00398B9499
MFTDFNKNDDLAGISLRHLEVFSAVVREGSFANAAIELQMSGANVKRIYEGFRKIVGRDLLVVDDPDRIEATVFGRGLFSQLGPLARSLRKMEESVRQLHQAGRVLRFGAAGGFFREGLFTDYLSGLEVSKIFRSCYIKVEPERALKCLLANECDLYFGIGLGVTERLDRVDLGEVGWKIHSNGTRPLPEKPADLKENWFIKVEGDPGQAEEILRKFRDAGAEGGETFRKRSIRDLGNEAIVFCADLISPLGSDVGDAWPCYEFSVLLRKHHPYNDLKQMLGRTARKESHGR